MRNSKRVPSAYKLHDSDERMEPGQVQAQGRHWRTQSQVQKIWAFVDSIPLGIPPFLNAVVFYDWRWMETQWTLEGHMNERTNIGVVTERKKLVE